MTRAWRMERERMVLMRGRRSWMGLSAFTVLLACAIKLSSAGQATQSYVSR